MRGSSWHDALHGLIYLLFVIPPLLLGLWAQHWVKSSFAKWSQVSAGNVSGAEVARRILAATGSADPRRR